MARIPSRPSLRRMIYPRPIAALPDILMVDVSAENVSDADGERFHPILVETAAELGEIDQWLDRPPRGVWWPEDFNHRPSLLATPEVVIAHYAPLSYGWPFVLLCRWPDSVIAMARRSGQLLRECYTCDLFMTHARIEAASDALVAAIERGFGPGGVATIAPDWSPPADLLH
ncbi:MAG: uncharacterized protein JWR80_7504 [Bradyrhizobium sp.]|nr:uncharacterized protein [Bradyrhizobium sp.]